jgi:hypothetical protein
MSMVPNAVRALSVLLLSACGAAQPGPNVVQAPPTPASVTRAEPGGDAQDPQAAALTRLLESPWGARSDKDDQLLLALPDPENWKRVRFFGVEHFVGFRYGNDHHALAAVFVQEAKDLPEITSAECLKRFEAWGRPRVQAFDVDFKPFSVKHGRFRERSRIAFTMDGSVLLGFSRPDFSAAWTAYAIYPGACLISAIAVPWRKHPQLARKVRDRFVEEGFGLIEPKTETAPYRR